MTPGRAEVAWAAAAALAAGSVHEVLVAAEVVGGGDLPGAGATCSGFVRTLALLSYLLGAAVCVARAVS